MELTVCLGATEAGAKEANEEGRSEPNSSHWTWRTEGWHMHRDLWAFDHGKCLSQTIIYRSILRPKKENGLSKFAEM